MATKTSHDDLEVDGATGFTETFPSVSENPENETETEEPTMELPSAPEDIAKDIVEPTINDILEQMDRNYKSMNYHDQVLEYLKNQETYGGEDIDFAELMSEEELGEPKESPEEIKETAHAILNDLLSDVNNITLFREAYEKQKQFNNQFDLFDLSKYVSGFHINDIVMETMSFRETLLISKVDESKQYQPVGGLCLGIQTAMGSKWDKPTQFPDFTLALFNACEEIKKGTSPTAKELRKDLEEYRAHLEEEMRKEQKKFVIHLSSQFNVDGNNAGSRITAWVDKNLHTLEERRMEYIEHENGDGEKILLEKKVHVYMGKKCFSVTTITNEKSKMYYYSFQRAENYIGEAANFILMRYLAIVKFIGNFELSAIHIDGGLCRNVYNCEGPIGGKINNEHMDLYKIYRILIEECGITHRSCTILSLDGRIMKHDWENCCYVLQINPLMSPVQKKSTLILHFDEAWKYDLQLLSRYLDKKTTATLQMKNYLHDHKEVGSLINDFVQNILQIKPNNIIRYAKHYFLSYAPYLIPRAEYFEEDVNKGETQE